MVRHLDAIFEAGVLRPLEPLELSERQRVRLTVDDAPVKAEEPEVDYYRYEEMAWIAEHADEYAGQWVALKGSRLVAHGHDPIAFRQAVKESGVERPLFHHYPEADELPFGGW
jgi:predicted DNA-binding antitoxin AbrB/MazE fold protein